MALSYTVGEVVDSAEVAKFKTAFSTESKHRNFKLQCKDDVIFVNGVFLSELSEFFDAAYFGSFSEAENKSLILPEESLLNVLEFLAIIYGRKSVNDKNCAAMLRYADLWNIPSLQLKCKEYLGDDILLCPPSLYDSVNILEIALSTGSKDLVENVVSRLASATFAELDAHNVLTRIVDAPVIAAIYSTIPLQTRVAKQQQQHNYGASEFISLHITGGTIPHPYNYGSYDIFARAKQVKPEQQQSSILNPQPTCNFSNCNQPFIYKCSTCGLKFCQKHKCAVDCPMRENDNGKKPVYLKVTPYKKNHVPVNTNILFKQ